MDNFQQFSQQDIQIVADEVVYDGFFKLKKNSV